MRRLENRWSRWLLAAGCLWCAAAVEAVEESRAELLVMSRHTMDVVRHMAIQHRGRHKPFDSFAREVLEQVTGSSRAGREDPAATVLSIIAMPERWQNRPLVHLPFIPLREALGFGRKAAHVSYNELVAARTLMRMLPPIIQKQRRDEKLSMLEQETMDAYERFVALSALFEHRLELVPPASPVDPVWLPILQPTGHSRETQDRLQNAWASFVATLRADAPEAVDRAARELSAALRSANPPAYPAAWRLDLEVFYNRFEPFRIARWLYLVAALGLLLSLAGTTRMGSAGAAALWAAFALHAGGMVIRVAVSGRPPVSNFYETMLWLPFVAVALALLFDRIYRVRDFGAAAAMLSAVMLGLADHLPLDPSISPVAAVLRSNLWLTIHVLTIVASYGAFALAAVLAHLYGALYLGRRLTADGKGLETFLYRTIQVGVVLLAAGIMLGAVWANASWGRYWGWDPKETWALITLLWFLALLHGRSAGWVRGVGTALATISGFLLLLMTYYGVSFYLVGLHSYAGGHAKPLPFLLSAYLIAEVAFLLAVSLTALRRQSSRRT